MNPARSGLAISDPPAYRERLFALLGDQDAREVLSRTAATLADIVNEHPATLLRTRPFEGQWTPNEVIGHLADSEWIYGYRLRLILCEDDPSMLGADQDLWVTRQRHNEREPSELVELFGTLRQFNLASWDRVAPADFQRAGRHNERGPETLAVMLRMLAGHDLAHLDQVTRLIAAVRARG